MEDYKFYIILGFLAVLFIVSTVMLRMNKSLEWKKRVNTVLICISNASLVGAVIFLEFPIFIVLLSIPVAIIFVVLGIKGTKFCSQCGKISYNQFSARCCPKCGNVFGRKGSQTE